MYLKYLNHFNIGHKIKIIIGLLVSARIIITWIELCVHFVQNIAGDA